MLRVQNVLMHVTVDIKRNNYMYCCSYVVCNPSRVPLLKQGLLWWLFWYIFSKIDRYINFRLFLVRLLSGYYSHHAHHICQIHLELCKVCKICINVHRFTFAYVFAYDDTAFWFCTIQSRKFKWRIFCIQIFNRTVAKNYMDTSNKLSFVEYNEVIFSVVALSNQA